MARVSPPVTTRRGGKPTTARAREVEAVRAGAAVAARDRVGAIAIGSTPAAHVDIAGSAGAPLPDALRARLEHSFGADLAQVRLHLDAPAIAVLRDVGARGFAAGRDVFVDLAAHELASDRGLQLVGHEVAHVLQQTGRKVNGRLAATAAMSTPSAMVQHDEIIDALDEYWSDSPPTYLELKQQYKGSAAEAWFAKTDALIGSDWDSTTDAGKAISKLIAEPDHSKRPSVVRRFLHDCAKALGAFDAIGDHVTKDGLLDATPFRSLELYKHLRTKPLTWLPIAISKLQSLKRVWPDAMLEGLRHYLFALQNDVVQAPILDAVNSDFAWAKAKSYGEPIVAAIETFYDLHRQIAAQIINPTINHADTPNEAKWSEVEKRRWQSRYIAALPSPDKHVKTTVPEHLALLTHLWPKVRDLAKSADTYWTKVISIRDALQQGKTIPGMTVKELDDFGAALPKEPLFPMFGRTLTNTLRELLGKKLKAADFTKVRNEQIEKHTGFQNVLDKLRRVRADKHHETGENAIKLGAAAAILEQLTQTLSPYDAVEAAEEEREHRRNDQRLALQIRLALFAREWAEPLELKELARLGDAFLGEKPMIAITGEWKPAVANLAHFKSDMHAGARIFGAKMTVHELAEWVEAGVNLELIAQLKKEITGPGANGPDGKSVLDRVNEARLGNAGLFKFTLTTKDYQPWFDPKWVDPTTKEVSDEQAFTTAVFNHSKTDTLVKDYPTHLAVSRRSFRGVGVLWVWLIPRIDVWIEKIIANPEVRRVVEPWLRGKQNPTFNDWQNAIREYLDYLSGRSVYKPTGDELAGAPDAIALATGVVVSTAAAERLRTQDELALLARQAAAKQLRTWIEIYDESDRATWWVVDRIFREMGTFGHFVPRAHERKLHVAALVIDVAQDLADNFTPRWNRSLEAIGVTAIVVSGTVAVWNNSPASLLPLLHPLTEKEIVARIVKLTALGQALREAARAEQVDQGMSANLAGQYMQVQPYSAKLHCATEAKPDIGFEAKGTYWRVKAVHADFKYHPPFPDLMRARMLGIDWPDSPSWIEHGIIEKPDGTPITGDTPLISVSKIDLTTLDGEDFTITAKDWVKLGQFHSDLGWYAGWELLDTTKAVIEAGAMFVIELAEFIPGIGQGIMAARFAITVADFLIGNEFTQLMTLLGNQGLGALLQKATELESLINIPELVSYMLYSGQKWTLKPHKYDPGNTHKYSSGKWDALKKVITNIVHVVRNLLISIQNVRRVVQVPFRSLQVFVAGRPLVSSLVGVIVDNFSTFGAMSLDDVSSIIGIDQATLPEVAQTGTARIVEGVSDAFSNLRLMQVPARIVDMALIAETVINVIIEGLGKKAEFLAAGGREAMKTTKLWSKVMNAIGRKLASVADPNDLWRGFLDGALKDTITKIRDKITNEVRGTLDDFDWLTVPQHTGAEMKLEPEGDDFTQTIPNTAPSADPFLDEDPAAMSLWANRPAIAIPANGGRLDPALRARAESVMGQDLGHVRLHEGAAGASGTPPGARAVTAGSHIFLGPTVDRLTPSGASVLFHELAHVVQQTGPRPLGATQSTIPVLPKASGVVWNRAAEEAADRVAAKIDANTIDRFAGVGESIGLQPNVGSETARKIIEGLVHDEKIRKEAEDLSTSTAGVRSPQAQTIDPIAKAVAEKILAQFKTGTIEKPFDQVRDEINLVVGKLDLQTATRNVLAKGKLNATTRAFELSTGTLETDLKRFLFGRAGLVVTLELNGPGKLVTQAATVSKFSVDYLHLPDMPASEPLVVKALDNAYGFDAGNTSAKRRRLILAAKMHLTRKPDSKLWAKTAPFRFSEDAKTAITTVANELVPVVEGDTWPSATDYASPTPVAGSESVGIRVGTYGSQRAWISGSKRDAHHVLQVVFIKFLENQFTGAKPFSYLYNFPKAYKKLGIESSGGLATAIHGPGGDLRLDVKHFAGGTRADEMPTIFLSNFTHRARLHLVPEEGTMRRSLLSAFRGGNREELFKATLEDRKTLGKIRDTDDVDRAIDGAGDVSFTIKELREKVYEGARAAYRRAWEPEHQQKLRDGVYRHEPAYYNSVVKERLASDKPVTTPSKLEGAMTTAAVNAVIKAVDDLIGKDGFKPA